GVAGHEAAAFQPGPEGGVEGGGHRVVEGQVVGGEGVAPAAVGSPVEKGGRATDELVHGTEEPGRITLHRLEAGRLHHRRPGLLGHRVTDVGGDAAHLAVEVALQVV